MDGFGNDSGSNNFNLTEVFQMNPFSFSHRESCARTEGRGLTFPRLSIWQRKFMMRRPGFGAQSNRIVVLMVFAAIGIMHAQTATSLPLGNWSGYNAGGGWEGILECAGVAGTTDTTIGDFDTATTSVSQNGHVQCTFTPPDSDPIGPADCELHIDVSNLVAACDGSGLLEISGTCPDTYLTGSIDCGKDNMYNTTGEDALFCGFAGNDSSGNPSDLCEVNLGIANKQGNPLTSRECDIAFPDGVFFLPLRWQYSDCTGGLQYFGEKIEYYCHSDTWDPSKDAVCEIDHQNNSLKHPAQASGGVVLRADTSYNKTINTLCNGNAGKITLTVYGDPQDPTCTDCVMVDVNAINDLTVNGRDPIPGTINISGTELTAQFYQCVDGDSIADEIVDGNAVMKMTATLQADNDATNTIYGTSLVPVTSAGSLISINSVTAAEGGSSTQQDYTFTVSLSKASTSDIDVYFSVLDGTATVSEDYDLSSPGDHVHIPAGATTASEPIKVTVYGDTAAEEDETFQVVLTSFVSTDNDIGFLTNTGTGTITNDDYATITFADISNPEGGKNETTPFDFEVTLNGQVGSDFALSFATQDGTAVSTGRNKDRDFVSVIGTIVFNKLGATPQTQHVTVNVNGDTTVEPNETFTLELLGDPPNGVSFVEDNISTATILNDD